MAVLDQPHRRGEPSRVLSMLYEVGDDRWLPEELRGERTGLRYIARPRHRLSTPERQVARASDADALALLQACRSARDRFIVVLLGRTGMRRGEVVGLRRPDMHLLRGLRQAWFLGLTGPCPVTHPVTSAVICACFGSTVPGLVARASLVDLRIGLPGCVVGFSRRGRSSAATGRAWRL
jgi:hypothetical protein